MNRETEESEVNAAVERMVTNYVERSPFVLNPDRVVVRNIVAGLSRNKQKYGYAYCPCRKVDGIPEKDRYNICPCRTHKEEIDRQGTCECGLFVSKAYVHSRTHDYQPGSP